MTSFSASNIFEHSELPACTMSAQTDLAIRIDRLCKRYDHFFALDGLTLDVERGQIFGPLGPNGAGKSTAIKILTTLLNASSGSARENLILSARLYGLHGSLQATRVNAALAFAGLDPSGSGCWHCVPARA